MPEKSALRKRVSPPVPLNLHVEDADGAHDYSFQLSYDINALCLIEEYTGLSVVTDLGKLFSEPSIRNVSVMLWAALQEFNPEFTGRDGLRLLRSLITLGDVSEIINSCAKAFMSQLPRDHAEKVKAILDKTAAPLAVAPPPTAA